MAEACAAAEVFPTTTGRRPRDFSRFETSERNAEAMPGVRRVKGEESETLERSADKNAGRASSSKTKTRPGLVQNWPAPRVKEACRAAASFSGAANVAPGRMNRGL